MVPGSVLLVVSVIEEQSIPGQPVTLSMVAILSIPILEISISLVAMITHNSSTN